MYALEITFRDGISQPEMIFIRRPQALIGASDYAHVVVEDMKELNFQLRLVRELGRRFRCKPVAVQENLQIPSMLEGSYEGEAAIDLGKIKFYVTALDFDLLLKENEPPDRAGVRVIRRVCSSAGPLFPAVVVRGNPPMVISFVPDQPIFIGRSKYCALRLDSAEISARHARLGYESGEFWIEDLGSTNGTYVNQQQISGRVNMPPGTPVTLGREVTIVGVVSEDQIEQAVKIQGAVVGRAAVVERKYPVLVSVSEVARPARVVIPPGATLTIGRDPGCDMWLGAPHVSRRHCSVEFSITGSLKVTDSSTNGTAYDGGVLKRGDVLNVGDTPRVLDFGGGVTVAICFNEAQEKEFTAALGSQWAFSKAVPGPPRLERSTAPSSASLRWVNPRLNRAERGVAKLYVESVGQFLEFYRSLSLSARAFMIFIFLVLAMVVGVLISLLLPVLG